MTIGSTPICTVVAVALTAPIAASGAREWQDVPAIVADTTPVACQGETVTEIDIEPTAPGYGAEAGVWRMMENVAGRRHPVTREEVIASFLGLRVGEPCTEVLRAETERVLRAQPFLASASVRAIPDGAGGVRIEVGTVDEVPLVIGGRVSGATPEAINLGDANVMGRALHVEASAERGGAYRDGFGIEVANRGILGGPYVAAVAAERRPLGSLVKLDFAKPFYTDLQRTAWRFAFQRDNGYLGFVRPAADALALGIEQTRWEVGGILRQRFLGQVGVIGALVSGVRVTPADRGVIVSDSGFASDTGVTLDGRYSSFRATRPALLAGLRVVRFTTVQGFNTLTAVEDLPSGVQLGALVGRGLPGAGANDLFLAGSMYAGRATSRSYLALQVEAETRRDFDVDRWDGLIVSGRVARYAKRSDRHTFVLSDEFAGGFRPRLPVQLTFSGRESGLRGYRGALLAGAWRNVIRAEHRWVLGSPFRRADIGFAGFADAGTLWAGSAPYGETTLLRGSVGASILAAYPSGSRRLLRLDVAVPVTRDGNDSWELRFRVADLTRAFWREPGDVARARTGPVPSSLFSWPTR